MTTTTKTYTGMTTNDRIWHREYESLTTEQKRALDNAFDLVWKSLNESGQFGAPPVDDRAEALVAALTRFACGA